MMDALASLLYFSIFFLALFVGTLALSSFQRLVGSDVLGRIMVAQKRTLPLALPLIILFFILCLGLRHLFPWTAEHSEMKFRSVYLSPLAFYLRNIFYFVLWSFFAFRSWKLRPAPAPLTFILMMFSVTFAAVDWIESLSPEFYSTAFGLIFFFSSALVALGFYLWKAPENLSPESLIKLNNIHLALIGSWTYLVFMQFIIIWSGNVSSESSWFVTRIHTDWGILAVTVAVFQFAVPVFLLFFRALKKSLAFSRRLAAWTMIMQAIYIFWLVIPSIHQDGIHFSGALILSMMATVIGVLFLSRWRPHGVS